MHHAGLRGFKYTEQLFFSAINATTGEATLDNVESGASLVVNFSEAIEDASVTATNFALKHGTINVAAARTLSADKKTVTIAPTTGMTVGKEYTLTVASAVKAAASDKTLGSDVVKTFVIVDSLAIVKVESPAGTALSDNVTAVNNIVFTFNKNLDASTVTTGTVKIKKHATATTPEEYLVIPTGNIGVNNNQVTITQAGFTGYVNNATYTLELNGIKSLDNKTINNYQKTWSVGAAPTATTTFTAEPQGIGISANAYVYPGINASTDFFANSGVNPRIPLTTATQLLPFRANVVFSQAMDETTFTQDNIYIAKVDANNNEIADTKVAVNFEYSAPLRTLTVTPAQNLENSTRYALVITKGVKSAFGAPKADVQRDVFITGDFSAPTVTSTNVEGGATVAYNGSVEVKFNKRMHATNFAVVNTVPDGTIAQNPFTATASIRVVDLTANKVKGAAFVNLNTAFLNDAEDPRLIITPATAWAPNTSYRIDFNGYDIGETTLPLVDAATTTPLAKNHFNMMKGDYQLFFTTAEAASPAVTSVKGISYLSPVSATVPNLELSSGTASAPVPGVTASGTDQTNEVLSVTFDQAMKADGSDNAANKKENYKLAKLTGGNWVDVAGYPNAVAVVAGTDNKSFTLTATDGNIFAGEGIYRLTIARNIQSIQDKAMSTTADKVIYFTTTVAAPAVNTVQTGASGAYNVNLTGAAINRANLNTDGIKIVFSENARLQTLIPANFKVTNVATGEAVAGQLFAAADKTALSADTDTVYWFPATTNAFAEATSYRLTINGVTDAAYTPMAAPHIRNFTTVTTAAPTIVSTSVQNGAQDVSVDPVITIEFSQNVSTTAPSAATIQLNGGAVPVSVNYTAATKTATVKPLVYLAPLTQYTLSIDNSIASASGNLGVDTNISFVTENVTKNAAIESAVWNATAKTLTIVLDKPVKAGQTIETSDIITAASFGTGFADGNISISLDRKTIVIQAVGTDFSVIPGVHSVSFKTGGNVKLSDDSMYKQNIDVVGNQTAANSITIQ